jgi:hypothetical protein
MTTILELPDVARSFSHFCKKCEQDRLHKVLVHVDAKTAKIECEICKKKSTFKLTPPKAAKTTKPRAKSTKPKTVSARSPSWDDLNTKLSGQKSRPYRISETFSTDTPIEHPKFGTGYVITASPDRIEAVFREGMKLLIHNKAN